MEEILQKARELGMMIADSKEFANLKAAEEKQMNDPDATLLMMNYSRERDALAEKASKPGITPEEMQKLQDDAQKAFEKICVNENIKAYLDANSAFSSLINQVNSIMGYFIRGNEASGCSGNCSSCGGCH